MRKVFLIILLTITIFSCTKELDYELENIKSLVINSVFYPDNNFTFHVSTTASTLEKYDTLKERVQLLLYENDYLIIDTMLGTGTFQTNYKPISNIKYTVKILSNSLQSITASDSIPNSINIDDATLLFPVGVDEMGDEYGEFSVKFTDPANEKNYYELAIYHYINGEKVYYEWYSDYYKVTDPVLINEGLLDYLPTTMFFSDELFDGEIYTLRFKDFANENTSLTSFNSDIYAELRSISKSYYLYRKSYTIHAFNQQTNYEDLHDFLYSGEPQNMYTNVNNGFGIFVGYNKTSKEFIYTK
ncbi:MAG: hypothetical protein A2W99_06680 [Bacteroidetes bacterium GWF2_33_16]|nr:MAG: hypothetical protein A2X00_12115 [Bacteroidetes bacterium GWE2_32_14]OFY04380.1 MAG: hypothetical protein A2W99_06680 [Bacteroidetes bacterium GWF2_33_16]